MPSLFTPFFGSPFSRYVVSAGVTSSGLTIGPLDTITVLSSGTMTSITISGGGQATISSGGLAQFDTVSSNGIEDVLASGLADGEKVFAGGMVEGAGVLLEADIFGVVTGVSLEDFNVVESGGLISGATIAPSGANTTSVLNGGSATDVLVSGAATELRVFDGGEADGVSLSAGGDLVLLANATAMSAVIGSGGGILVEGGIASSVVVSSGGTLELFGPVLGDNVATAYTGGTIRLAGGISDGDVLSGGVEIVEGDSEAENFQVGKGGALTVQSLGVADGGNVSSGGEVIVSGRAAIGDTLVESGGLLILDTEAVVGSGDEVTSGGLVRFLDPLISGETVVLPSSASLPATLLGVTVDSGGRFQLIDTTVGSGGVLSFGDSLSGATVAPGGRLLGPGTLVGDSFLNLDHGLVSGVGLGAGVTFVVAAGGVASAVQERGIGSEITIDSGGVGVGLQELAALGRLKVARGGVATGTIVDAGADDLVFGVASTTHVSSGGAEYVEAAGKTQAALVLSGGLEQVDGGVAISTTVSSGGALQVASGATASGAVVRAGATETVLAHGVAKNAFLLGAENVLGQASGTSVRSGGHEIVGAGGVESGSLVIIDGEEDVAAGGATIAATISGGLLVVSSGGIVSGGLTLDAGKVVLSGAMAAGQTVSFAGGVLELDNLAGFKAKISGLATSAQKLDLGGFAFSAGETVTWTPTGTSGTLTVHDGASTASLTLIGTYVTSDFHLANDGHGGAYVTDPKAASPHVVRFAAAAAGFAGREGGAVALPEGANPLRGNQPVVAVATSGR